MEVVRPEERATTLRPLLPATPEPGTQAGFHFLDQKKVGEAFVTDDGRSALVIENLQAWIYGEPSPQVGLFLKGRGFGGSVSGAVGSLDPRPALEVYEPLVSTNRMTWLATRNFDPPDPPEWYRPRLIDESDREALLHCTGRWVFELWEDPINAQFAWVAYVDEALKGVAGAYTLSDRYVEIAAWFHESIRGQGLALASNKIFTTKMFERGRQLTWLVKKENAPVLKAIENIGWGEPMGDELAYRVGDRLDIAKTLRDRLKRFKEEGR